MDSLFYYLNELFFGYYPYFAFFTFFIGSIARYEYAQYEWKSSSSQLLRKSGMRLGSNLFHIGIIFVLCGHFVGLLTPHFVYVKFISSTTKQWVAMITGGFFGLLCFVGLTMLLYRRLFDVRIRATSTVSDILLLVILYVQLILGLSSIYVSATEPGFSNTMVSLGYWAQHIVTCSEFATTFIKDVHWVFKLHVFLGLTLLVIFPFTRLVHILSVPVGYVFRTGYQIVRIRG